MKKQGIVLLLFGCFVACLLTMGASNSEPARATFSRSTIDLGMVVADIEASARFYQEVIGFTQAGTFSVSPEMAADTGLTDHKAINVRVFALGKEPTATKLKIMAFPDAPVKRVDNEFISSSLGYSYLTIFVSDMTEALARLKAHAVTPVKKPYQLGNANSYLTLVKDPDGNIIELIGPMK